MEPADTPLDAHASKVSAIGATYWLPAIPYAHLPSTQVPRS